MIQELIKILSQMSRRCRWVYCQAYKQAYQYYQLRISYTHTKGPELSWKMVLNCIVTEFGKKYYGLNARRLKCNFSFYLHFSYFLYAILCPNKENFKNQISYLFLALSPFPSIHISFQKNIGIFSVIVISLFQLHSSLSATVDTISSLAPLYTGIKIPIHTNNIKIIFTYHTRKRPLFLKRNRTINQKFK